MSSRDRTSMGSPKVGAIGSAKLGPNQGSVDLLFILLTHLQAPFLVGTFLFFSFVHVARS